MEMGFEDTFSRQPKRKKVGVEGTLELVYKNLLRKAEETGDAEPTREGVRERYFPKTIKAPSEAPSEGIVANDNSPDGIDFEVTYPGVGTDPEGLIEALKASGSPHMA